MILSFSAGTLLLSQAENTPLPDEAKQFFTFDKRTGCHTARGCDYAACVISLLKNGIKFTDQAKDYTALADAGLKKPLVLRPHQQESLDSWIANSRRGVAVLPTGSGKTILAVSAISSTARPALILVPTIDLLTQWANVLESFFQVPIGMLGGGSRNIEAITVSTYDSAVLNMEYIGNRFGLLIADECHHLPASEYRTASAMCIAPFRLGLTATPEMPPERQEILFDQMGKIVCRKHIDELSGTILSPYVIKTIRTELDPQELMRYRAARKLYTDFIRRKHISFSSPDGWKQFLLQSSRSNEGRAAFEAFLEQREIARGGREKTEFLRRIFRDHPGERIIIFTADNATAYNIGRKYMLPVITHLTSSRERKEFLECFRQGKYPVLVTSQVLNEGVDVPEAAVGVILSGSGSVREHVQRLGRILRPAPGKPQAVLYELISSATSEESVSLRRRDHRAYRQRRL